MGSRQNLHAAEESEDILSDSLAFLGGKPVVEDEIISYGPLRLTVAPKEGKANTLLADHLFSPALYLAERIERKLISAQDLAVIELGAGSALPSLLMTTLPQPPSLVVVTDYPDDGIIGNLKQNVERNKEARTPGCVVKCHGYEWGRSTREIMDLLPEKSLQGFDVVILSDLLHFHDCHDILISSVTTLLARSKASRVHVAAGRYTHSHVCEDFLSKAGQQGILFEEISSGAEWEGNMTVSGLDHAALTLRKANCRYWVGRWSDITE
ncbi:hypothetical protein BD779DRAFT_1519948 [Infundibulicybe gibba]|nr:hypothetical protein BD779DRAFT_1519948 [Infundibulicybe gibba]